MKLLDSDKHLVSDRPNDIVLTESIASHPDLERLNLFPGRYMGEEEFERAQNYVDQRIEPLLSSVNTGIINGLNVRESRDRSSVTINPGLAIARNGLTLNLFYPLRMEWQSLIESYLDASQTADAAGVFYLTLVREEAYVDADPQTRPCQRHEFDPTRDAKRVLVGTLSLLRLGIDASAVTTQSQESIENWVAANNLDGNLTASLDHAVPIALVAIENAGTNTEGETIYNVPWVSEVAGRYMSTEYSGYHVLFQQVSEAFRRTLIAAQDRPSSTTLLDYFNSNLQLDFLPAAGQFPAELIANIDSTSPSIGWLPEHLAVDMVAVPEETVEDLLQRHLPRRVVDLRQPSRDRIRVLLALGESDFRPDILNFPQKDSQLQDDIYRYFQRSYEQWRAWMRQYNALYFVADQDVLEPEDITALDLPSAIDSPQAPEDFYQDVIDEANEELGFQTGTTPYYPYNLGIPTAPSFYQNWLVAVSGQPPSPPPVATPSDNGLVVQYAIAQHELEAIDNQVRETRSRLELTRDYLLLQRQQLDNQTVSLAALAGGVAGDGSGLQVARWLPFSQLKAAERETTEPTEPSDPPPPDTTPTDSSANSGLFNVLAATAVKPSYVSYAHLSAASTAVKASNVASSTQNLQMAGDSLIGFNQLNSATNKNLLFASTLRRTPTIFSSLQFNLNNNRLDKIAEAPKQALTRPAFDAKEFRFGVLEHVRPEVQEYKKALRGMRELITTLTSLFSTTEANSLTNALENFGTPPTLTSLEINITSTNEGEREEATARIYEALFTTSQILTKQIAYMESRYNMIESSLEGRLRARINKESQLEKLAALITKATQELENIDTRRIEFLGDYGVAQRLLEDDWQDVYAENLERSRILTKALKGVYFVRERQVAITKALVDPLSLRYGQADDIVPGCDWDEDPDLPEELEDFFDTVMEVPMGDWATLKDLAPLVPSIKRLEFIEQIRRVRFSAKTSKKRFSHRLQHNLHRPVKASLYNVRLQSQSLLGHLASMHFPLTLASAKARAEASSKVMSLEDLVSGSRGKLQKQAQVLSRRLEQAASCLLEKLDELPPSLRLQWAQLAEDDRLYVEEVARWPGLERAERDDFNTTRTVAELVQWWFRQLHKSSSTDGRNAMRNMLRAIVIQSALGDPAEILQGEVQVPPRKLGIGEPLRLRLNQRALPGTTLQLLDTRQRLIAMLNIDDDDDSGTTAKVTRVVRHIQQSEITTKFRVVASKAHRRLR